MTVEKIIVDGVVWYEVKIPLSNNTHIIKRLSESEIKRLRDQINSALK